MIKKKTLYLYLLKEIFGALLIGIFIFSFVILTNRLIRLMDMVVNKGVSIWDVVNMILFLLPSSLVFTIPMSFLLAVLIVLGRLSADGELTTLKASGISLYQMLPPFVITGIVCFFITLFSTLFLFPQANYALRNLIFHIIKGRAEAAIQEKVFNDDFRGLVLYVNEVSSHTLKGIFLVDTRQAGRPTIIIAKRGRILSDPDSLQVVLSLKDGTIHRNTKQDMRYQLISFDSYDMNLSGEEAKYSKKRVKKFKEMTLKELLALYKDTKIKKEKFIKLKTELNKRFSFPFACLVFGILGVALGFQRKRGSKSYSFMLSLVIILVYYLLLSIGESFGERGLLPPGLGIWLPNIVLGILGLYLLQKAQREATFFPVDFLESKTGSLLKSLKERIRR